MVELSARQLCLGKVGNTLNFGADPCCHGNEITPRHEDLDTYRRLLACYCYCDFIIDVIIVHL